MDKLNYNGVIYHRDDILSLCKGEEFKALAPWERTIFRFLADWWDEADTIVQHTSGSTGAPKPIALKKGAMLASARRTCDYFRLKCNTRLGLCLSADYIAGKMMILRAMVYGAELVAVCPDGHPHRTFEGELDFTAMVPLQAANMLAELEAIKARYRTILLGGADISRELQAQIKRQKTRYYLGYGMTETCSHVGLKHLGADDLYHAMVGVDFSLDSRGCLIIHDPATNDAPLVTNDMAEIRDGGFLWLGRYDNIINSGGIKFSPEVLEQAISGEIEENYFIGSLPDDRLGNKIILIVEDTNTKVAAHILTGEGRKQWLKKLRPLLPKYGCPQEIILVPELVRTANGKIARRASYWV